MATVLIEEVKKKLLTLKEIAPTWYYTAERVINGRGEITELERRALSSRAACFVGEAWGSTNNYMGTYDDSKLHFTHDGRCDDCVYYSMVLHNPHIGTFFATQGYPSRDADKEISNEEYVKEWPRLISEFENHWNAKHATKSLNNPEKPLS